MPQGNLWPVVMWLHGNGTQGNDGLLPTARGLADYIRRHRSEFPAVAVFPQAPTGGNWIEPDTQAMAMSALNKTLAEFNGDPDRVSLVGYSMGAIGSYRIAARWPERFSALVAIAGHAEVSNRSAQLAAFDRAENPYVNAPDPFAALADRLKPLAIRLYHGDKDATISVDQSRRLFAALKHAGSDVSYTEFAGVDHNDAPDKALFEAGLFEWLLSRKLRETLGAELAAVWTDGSTRDMQVLQSLDAGTLDQAAVKAFEHCGFGLEVALGNPCHSSPP